MMEPTFLELLDFHADLEEVFALHQESLLLLRVESARALLSTYRELLALHMRHEEQTLLPVFARAGSVPKWPAVLYTGQHEKMRGMLERVASGLGSLPVGRASRLRRAVLALLDQEATYKHLHEHHDGAEREGLFPISDRESEPAERAELIRLFRSEWKSALDEHRAVLDAAREDLGG